MKKIIYTILLMVGSYSFAQGYPKMETMTLVPQNEPTSPIEGQIYYDVNQKVVFVYDGSDWVNSLEDTDNQTAAEVAYTSNSQSTVNGALNDLYSKDAGNLKLSGNPNIISGSGFGIKELNSGLGINIGMPNNLLTMSGGDQSTGSAVSLYLGRDEASISGLSNAEIDAVGDGSLITKGYADANYSGDQTASEVSFTPNGSIAATTVQAAIEEVRDEASGSGLTTEQEERIDNAGIVKTIAIAGDVTLTAENFDPSTVGDRGKKVLNTTTSDFELTLPDLSVGKTALFQPTSVDASFTIVPDVGVSFVGNGTDVIEEGFIVDSLNVAGVTKIAANTYSIAGYVKPYDVPETNLAVTSNAASPTNESDSTTGFTNLGSSISSTEVNPILGTSSIEFLASSGSGGERLNYELTGLSSGDIVRVQFDYIATSGASLAAWQGVVATPASSTYTADGTLRSFDETITLNSNTLQLRWYPGIVTGNGWKVDNLIITKID